MATKMQRKVCWLVSEEHFAWQKEKLSRNNPPENLSSCLWKCTAAWGQKANKHLKTEDQRMESTWDPHLWALGPPPCTPLTMRDCLKSFLFTVSCHISLNCSWVHLEWTSALLLYFPSTPLCTKIKTNWFIFFSFVIFPVPKIETDTESALQKYSWNK